MIGKAAFRGSLTARKLKASKAPLSWRLKNWSRWDFILGLLTEYAGRALYKMTGAPVLVGKLKAVHWHNGRPTDYGTISRRVVTTAFCELMVDQLIAETSVWGDFKWHDSGVGTTAAAIGDTDIETTDGESRVSGTQVESTSVIYESVGTITYTTTKAITEHGLFNASTSVTLMDRHVFAAINVVNTDSIQFTYDLTCTAGG